MRVAILSQYYAPEPLPKAQEMAEGLRDLGHEVTVITGYPNYPSGRLYPGFRIRPWAVEAIHGIRVVRLALYPDHSRSGIRRIANYCSFALAASLAGPFLCGTPDVMFVFHPPLTIGIAAWVISQVRRVPFVYGVADLWPDAIMAAGMLTSRPAIALLERLERFVYARASAVAVVSPGMVDHLVREGVRPRKLHVITDWADERVYGPVPRDAALAERLGMRGKFNVVFGGQLGILQRLDVVLEAAELLRPHPDVQFVIAGDGVERARLERETAVRHLGNVRFTGRLAAAEMPAVYALADALLVHLSSQPIFRMSIPAKTYAYLACGKPILMAMNGDAAELIRSSGAGLTCPPEDPAALADAVLTLLHMPPVAREELGRRARETFLAQYARSAVLRRCEALLTSVAARGTAQ
jgi:colanic acid biosynthesis glycosyl transferase WcaI